MEYADEVWLGGDILTMNPVQPRAEAMAISNGKIIAVGADQEIANLMGPGTKRRGLHGLFVMPGLVDSHTHALWGACRDLFDIYVGYDATFDDLIRAVKNRAGELPAGEVIYGGPWRLDMRAQMGSDPKRLLDDISMAHPIVLLDTSQHILWCNSTALEQAGITKTSPAASGGEMERTATGAPNGILSENAGAPVRTLLKRTPAQLAQAVQEFVRYFHALGITAFKEPMAYEKDLCAYYRADQSGALKLHMAAHIARQSPMTAQVVSYDEMDRLRRKYASENIKTDFAKLFLDGVAPGHTASFIDPYLASSGYDVAAHDPNATLLMSPPALNETLIALDARGYTVKMHAIGDNAIRKGLDAIEAARMANGQSGLRHEIAHSVFVSDQDLGRFCSLGAIAEMSPKLWFPNAVTPAQIAVLGKERLLKSHRIGDLLHAEAGLIYGSDWPASAPDANPWSGLSGMMTRQNCNRAYPGHLAPGQAIDLMSALQIFTVNGAQSLGMEETAGSIMAGKSADFVVLNKNLADVEAIEIGWTEVQMTIWKGEIVFGS